MEKKIVQKFYSVNKVSLILLCFLFINPMFAQYEAENEFRRQQYIENIQPNYCGTKDLPANINGKAVDIAISERLQNLRSSNAGTWNLNDGYGNACVQNCAITNSSSCSASNDLFRIPVVYTLSNSSCSTSIPSTTELQAQIDVMNDFYVCQGIDIFYYLPTNISAAPGGIRSGNFGCTYNSSSIADLPNVVNVYVFSNTGNGTGCNGFAPLPFSTNSSTAIVMSHNCYNNYVYTSGSLNCSNVNMGLGQVLVHEFGHYLGLYHTHNTGNGCDDPNTASDDCTNGDLIQDTDEDPDFSGGEIGCTGCNTGGPSSSCTFNNSNSPACQPYGTPNTLDNIMSYNLFAGCISDFSTCQKAKMMDALLCVRGLQACNRNVNMEFANGIMDANQQICIGDPIPTFTTTGACYKWFDGLGASANQVASGSSFTPNAAQVDNTQLGTYTFYLGDFNEYNPDCRTELTIEVLTDPGAATVNSGSSIALTTCPQSVSLTTNVTSLPTNGVVGWWFTEDNPISNLVTDQSSLFANMPNVSSTFGIGNIIKSTSGSPQKNLALSIDCTNLSNSKTYYATPVVAEERAAIPDASCIENDDTGFSSTFNGFPSKTRITNASSVCDPNPICTPPTYTYCVTVTGYNGVPSQLSIATDDNSNFLKVDFNIGTGSGNGTYCFSETDFGGYDPSTLGLRTWVWQQGGNGMASASVSTTLDITYAGKPAIAFPNLTDYNDCLFGTPISFTCACGGNPCPADYAGGGALSGTESGTVDYETDGSIESTQVMLNGAVVDYDAGTDITLLPNFEVVIGAQFSAFIDGCGGMMIQENESQTANK